MVFDARDGIGAKYNGSNGTNYNQQGYHVPFRSPFAKLVSSVFLVPVFKNQIQPFRVI